MFDTKMYLHLICACLIPKFLLHRLNLQSGQGELEVGSQVLVDIDMGGRGNCNGRDPWFRGVHMEGDHASRKVDDRVLRHLLGALVYPQLHVEVPSAQVGHHQPVVPVT